MGKTWARHKTKEKELNNGWRLAAVGAWRLAGVGGRQLVFAGGWRLVVAVVVAVGGWWSLEAVLNKMGFLRTALIRVPLSWPVAVDRPPSRVWSQCPVTGRVGT